MRRIALVLLVAAVAAVGLSVSTGDHSPPSISRTAPGSFAAPPPGDPAVGDVLFATPGQWSGSPTGFAYQWNDCDSGGSSCAAAAGSPNNVQRYKIVSGDEGSTIRVAVTASFSGRPSATVMSAPTTVVPDSGGGFTVDCALTFAAGAVTSGTDNVGSTDPALPQDGSGGQSTCWGLETGVFAGTGDTEAAIEANPTSLGFTHHTGDLTLNTNGQTINKEWVDGGCINIRANNVTVENTLITDHGPDCSGSNTGATGIDVDQEPSPTGTLIEDVTMDGTGGSAAVNGDHSNALTVQDGEVIGVNVFGYGQGFTSDTNDSSHPALFQDDYGHDYTGCEHDDGTWVDSGVFVTFNHIWIETNDPNYIDNPGVGCASGACYGGSDFGAEHDVTYENSFCDGVDGQDGQTGAGGFDITWANDVFDETASKHSFGGFLASCSGNSWTNNQFIDHSGNLTTADPPTGGSC